MAIKSDDYKRKIIDYLTDHVEGKASDLTELLGLKSSRTRHYLSKLSGKRLVIICNEQDEVTSQFICHTMNWLNNLLIIIKKDIQILVKRVSFLSIIAENSRT